MKAVILCGGKGTRIRDASEALPKPMLPIGGMPIVWHIMRSYAAHDVRDFVLCLGYKSWEIKQFFLNYRAMQCDLRLTLGANQPPEVLLRQSTQGAPRELESPWSVTLAETGLETQTGGRVASIRTYVERDDVFMLTYGDGVSDVNLTALLAFHKQHGRIATVTAVHPPGRFGELGVVDGAVAHFNEKPQTTSGFINGGFFVFDAKRIWDYITDDPEDAVLEHRPLQRLARAGELVAYEHHGFWQPMDTLREYNLLNALWESDTAPWKPGVKRAKNTADE